MKLLGWTLIQYYWCHHKEVEFGDSYIESVPCEHEDRPLQVRERGRPGTDFSLVVLRKNQPCQHLDLDFQPPEQ
jgi:hypothetical protein